MRRTLVTAVVVAVLLGATGSARAQEPSPAALSEADLHKIRGTLAWRRAAWRVERSAFPRVVSELEKARGSSQGKPDFTTLFLLGLSYLRLGRINEADAVLGDAQRMAPAFPGFLLAEGLRHGVERRTDDAIKALDEFLRVVPEYAKTGSLGAELTYLGFVFRGRMRARLPRFADKAIGDLEQALRISGENGQPASPDVISVLAQVHQQLDQSDEAERLVRTVLARDPAESSHYYNMGLLLAGQHKDVEAKTWFESALARQPDLPEAHLKLAYLARSVDRDVVEMRTHLEAFAGIQEARARMGGAALEPRVEADAETGFGIYWVEIGNRRREAGDVSGAAVAWEEAKRHFLRAVAKEPGCWVALNRLVQLAAQSGAPEEEVERYKEMLRKVKEGGGGEVEQYRSTFC